jgi:hypothetical protein
MYASHSITTHARPLTRLTRLALAAVALTLALGASVSPAQASVSDPTLFDNVPTTTLHTTPWWQGGGSCTASASARWDRAQNLLTLNGSAHTSAPFNGCKARLRVTFWANDEGLDLSLGSAAEDIPTACAVTDPSCPSTQPLNIAIPNAIPGRVFGMPKSQLIDHITLSVEAR